MPVVASPDYLGQTVQVFPYGIVMGGGESYPILVLRDEAGKDNLPVFLHPIAATNALFEVNPQLQEGAPHKLFERMLEVLGYKAEKCVFVEIRGPHQYVDLFLRKGEEQLCLRCRADEAMPYCLSTKVELYATRDHMAQARALEIHRAATGMDVFAQFDSIESRHPYLN